MELCDHVAVARLEGADDDAVGVHEVLHGGAFGRELRIGHVPDVLEATIIEPMTNSASCADRDGALHRDDDAVLDLRQLVDHGPDGRQVGIAGVGGRRTDGDVDDVGALDRLRHVRGERQSLAVTLEELLESGLVDGDDACLQRVDLRLDDVTDDDVVSELREACAGDEADVPRAEDRDLQRR